MTVTKRLLIIGWDAADWRMIDPLLASGGMPNLKHLIERGVRADLASLDPKLSPILWTSIATGKTADKHGILNFIEADATGSVRIVTSTSRRTKAIWNIFSQSGLRSVVVNWYASHPAEPINGVCVSNRFQESPPESPTDPWPILSGAVSPMTASNAVGAARVRPGKTAQYELRALIPQPKALPNDDRRVDLLRRLLAQCLTVHNVAKALSVGENWQCQMVFYDMIDVAGHHFMQYHPPRMTHVSKQEFAALAGVMNGVYRLHDRLLGDLLKAAGEDATVMIVSDHGFHCDHLRPQTQTALQDEHAAMDATWHRQTGILVLAGPRVRTGAPVHGAGLLDLAPTALTLLGLPVGEDMDGRVLLEALEGESSIARIPSWDAVEGASGQHAAGAQVEAFESREALKQLADLGYIQPLSDNVEEALRSVDRESRFNLGVVYMTTQRSHLALPCFKSLYAEFPNDVRFAMNLAHCQQATGDAAAAEQALDTYLRAHPAAGRAGEAQAMRAAILSAQGRFDESVAVLQASASESPNDPARWIAVADASRLGQRWEVADAALNRALTLDPRNSAAQHGRALLALAQRQFEQAAEYALDALERRPFMPEAHYTLGVALAWLGELDDARTSFIVAISQQPGMVDAHCFLGRVCEALGDEEAAALHRVEADRLFNIVANNRPQFTAHDPIGPDEWWSQRRPPA